MPLQDFTRLDASGAYALWSYAADEPLACGGVAGLLGDDCAAGVHPRRRLEMLLSRRALLYLLKFFGRESGAAIRKDAWGCPVLVDGCGCIGLSHSALLGAAIYHERCGVGIDVQLPCEGLVRARGRFLGARECEESVAEVWSLCVYWSAKEAIYKALGGRGLRLREDIRIGEFVFGQAGVVLGYVGGRVVEVAYRVVGGHVVAWCRV